MSVKPLLDKLLECRRRHPYGQFGTTDDESTDNGSIGCTHASWRFIIFVYTGKWLSHDQISKAAGFPFGGGSTNRGMRIEEGQQLARVLKLPYTYRPNMSTADVLRASNTGPVLFAMRYGSYPNWKDYRGRSVPSPFARPLGKAGRNQFTGFFGSHAADLLGFLRVPATGTFVRNDCYVYEPNHDSPARPEKVAFDVITQGQFKKCYTDVRERLGWSATMAFVPSRPPTFPGGLG